jgi:hypothetical protein
MDHDNNMMTLHNNKTTTTTNNKTLKLVIGMVTRPIVIFIWIFLVGLHYHDSRHPGRNVINDYSRLLSFENKN